MLAGGRQTSSTMFSLLLFLGGKLPLPPFLFGLEFLTPPFLLGLEFFALLFPFGGKFPHPPVEWAFVWGFPFWCKAGSVVCDLFLFFRFFRYGHRCAGCR